MSDQPEILAFVENCTIDEMLEFLATGKLPMTKSDASNGAWTPGPELLENMQTMHRDLQTLVDAVGRLTKAHVEMVEALIEAREAIASVPDDALGFDDNTGSEAWDDPYPITKELLAKIDAALAKAHGEEQEG